MKAVSIHNLVKRYGETVAVKNLSLTIPAGSIFSLLGPNGAGKTTTIHTLVGLAKKTSGEAQVFGLDAEKEYLRVRQVIGFVPQEMVLDNFFTVEEILRIQSGLYGIRHNQKKIEEIMERLELTPHRRKRMPELSGGMKRRLLVAKALVHSPDLLILDEPTAGVDVHLRHSLWEYVRFLNKQGMTILLTTHYLEEAERLADEVAILHKGEKITSGSPQELIRNFSEKTIDFILTSPISFLPEALVPFRPTLLSHGAVLRCRLRKEQTIPALLQVVKQAQLSFYDLHIQEGDLESVFLDLTKSSASLSKNDA